MADEFDAVLVLEIVSHVLRVSYYLGNVRKTSAIVYGVSTGRVRLSVGAEHCVTFFKVVLQYAIDQING